MRIVMATLYGAFYAAFVGAAGFGTYLLYGHGIGAVWLISTGAVALAVGIYATWEDLRPSYFDERPWAR